MATEFQLGKMTVLEMDCGDGWLHSIMKVFNITELCTYKWLNW